MTKAEWLAATDPWTMLDALGDRATERKLRLLACYCCRLIPAFMASEPDRRGLEVVELDVDGQAPPQSLDALEDPWDIRWYRRDGWNAVSRAITGFMDDLWSSERLYEKDEGDQELARSRHAGMLARGVREVFGDPFRPISAHPSWLTSTVVGIARAIYEDRAFGRLPVLADALEDAGCTDADLLAHCRSGGEHVRGCWAVDLLLGKT